MVRRNRVLKVVYAALGAAIVSICMCFAGAANGAPTAARQPGGYGMTVDRSAQTVTATVEHIFTHELVFDTAKAFASDNKLRDCYDKDHLTAKEFKALLGQLYDNGYVLISLTAALDGEIDVPQGKKPLVMSFDDMTYDTHGRGCIDKLVLENDRILDYTSGASPEKTTERENVTILESFIAEHPDFSHNGGRATLCVNGYNGVLGYRITPDCKVSEERKQNDTRECKALADKLKSLGYTFASHTYYHKYFNSCSAAMLEKDCAAWEKYIAPVVGETHVLCYPAGEHSAKAAKNDVFKRHGYNVFLCVGSYAGTDYEKSRTDVKYVYRRPFDGTALRLYGKLYAHLADTKAIYDTSRFRPFTYKGSYHK